MFKGTAFAVVVALTSGITTVATNTVQAQRAPAQESATSYYDKQLAAVDKDLKAGLITQKQASEKMAEVTRSAYPRNYGLQDFWNYGILVFSKAEAGQISQEEAKYLMQKKGLEVQAQSGR